MSVNLTWLDTTLTAGLTGTIKALLVTTAYVPTVAHDFRDDITGEVTGTGYTAGGVTVTGISVTVVGETVSIDFTDVNFGTLTVTGIAGIVLYKSTGSAATDAIIAVDKFDPVSASGTNFTYRPHASGFAVVAAAL